MAEHDEYASMLLHAPHQFVYSFETFFQVRLHAGRIFGLGKDLQEFIVGQEEKSWEINPFGLQVVVQACVGVKALVK